MPEVKNTPGRGKSIPKPQGRSLPSVKKRELVNEKSRNASGVGGVLAEEKRKESRLRKVHELRDINYLLW